MALVIERSELDVRTKMHTLAERTCVSPDGKRIIVEGKENGTLLGPAGARIPEAQAIALGLLKHEGQAAPEPAAEAAAPAPEDKAVKAPSRKGRK